MHIIPPCFQPLDKGDIEALIHMALVSHYLTRFMRDLAVQAGHWGVRHLRYNAYVIRL